LVIYFYYLRTININALSMNITKSDFGKLSDGRKAESYTLTNDNGMEVEIINYGGIVRRICMPDASGKSADVVLGYDSIEDYEKDSIYLGAIIGRFGNRIAKGQFILDNNEYKLAVNNGPNHLHGGIEGFNKKLWLAVPEKGKDRVSLRLAYNSPDMEEGYPGNLMIEVVYSLNNNNELGIEYRAECDKKTVINLTNHSYFNLNPEKDDILSHQVSFRSDFYAEKDENDIPTGAFIPVKDTPYDFNAEKNIGKDFDLLENGYDHHYVIKKDKQTFQWFARVEDKASGHILEAGTTEPGFQFYTGNYIDNIRGKNSIVYNKNAGFCLEAQHIPDSPNNPDFPSVVLIPGEQYYQYTVYKFNSFPV